MTSETFRHTAVAQAFDQLAPEYDTTFTNSSIGRAQRMAVWECAQEVFIPHTRLLELNCGTGEDALHFASQGFDVTACDVSPSMVMQARKKAASMVTADRLRFYVQATEQISDLPMQKPFAGVFSNFSGLNCVKDLGSLAEMLIPMLLPDASLLLCFSTRYCLWETAWHLFHSDTKKSFRRWNGYHETRLGDVTVPIYYPTCRQIADSFACGFRLVGIYGIGITVPPSYVESWVTLHPQLLKVFQKVDSSIRKVPGFRLIGDHVLLHFERSQA